MKRPTLSGLVKQLLRSLLIDYCSSCSHESKLLWNVNKYFRGVELGPLGEGWVGNSAICKRKRKKAHHHILFFIIIRREERWIKGEKPPVPPLTCFFFAKWATSDGAIFKFSRQNLKKWREIYEKTASKLWNAFLPQTNEGKFLEPDCGGLVPHSWLAEVEFLLLN